MTLQHFSFFFLLFCIDQQSWHQQRYNLFVKTASNQLKLNSLEINKSSWRLQIFSSSCKNHVSVLMCRWFLMFLLSASSEVLTNNSFLKLLHELHFSQPASRGSSKYFGFSFRTLLCHPSFYTVYNLNKHEGYGVEYSKLWWCSDVSVCAPADFRLQERETES